ncbi:hypothetical protein [Leptolyngbya sp. 7M]|uniref:hypothetical protein n=1 Tax=Leptolyngbya sp. 7M TaxID=2812896 RepID=UPI001B8BCE2A|nr:hypothetical protein [Leptolyngbya sp. 7M]QYO65408.1 hypothetical protein JVX88_01080 [Leptolyngbya sp. 7M]
MIQVLVFLAVFVISAISAFSQSGEVDFSGKWSLDIEASKLEARDRIESMTMDVSQSAAEITIGTVTKRAAPPDGGMGGRGGGMGMGRPGGDAKLTYSLDGKEKTIDQATPMGSVPVSLKAKMDSGKLKLSQTRTISGPMGEISLTTKEEWSLSSDGKTLTVKRETITPRGTMSSTLVFTKN